MKKDIVLEQSMHAKGEKMNKLTKFFYLRERRRADEEVAERGLSIIDEDKFDTYIKKLTRNNIITTILFALLVVAIILNWAGVIQ